MLEGRKRKRAAQLTACWECHRLHRACDGARPCKRCIDTDKASTCHSIGRKPYMRKVKPSEWINENIPSLEGSPCNYNSPTSTEETTSQLPIQQHLLGELLKQIKQVHEMTLSLQQRQDAMSQQLYSLSSAPCHRLSLCSPEPTPFDANCLPLYDLNPRASEGQSVWNTQQEFLDLLGVDHNLEDEARFDCSVHQDSQLFKKSLFIPFAIKDATTPFYVFKIAVTNWDTFLNYPHKPGRCDCHPDRSVGSITILTANSSFCSLSEYMEHELVGENIHKILPTHGDYEGVKKFVLQPSPNVHASDVIPRHCRFQTKAGNHFSGIANVQVFYCEGKMSFGVASVALLPTSEPPPEYPPIESSPISSFWNYAEDFCSNEQELSLAISRT